MRILPAPVSMYVLLPTKSRNFTLELELDDEELLGKLRDEGI